MFLNDAMISDDWSSYVEDANFTSEQLVYGKVIKIAASAMMAQSEVID